MQPNPRAGSSRSKYGLCSMRNTGTVLWGRFARKTRQASTRSPIGTGSMIPVRQLEPRPCGRSCRRHSDGREITPLGERLVAAPGDIRQSAGFGEPDHFTRDEQNPSPTHDLQSVLAAGYWPEATVDRIDKVRHSPDFNLLANSR